MKSDETVDVEVSVSRYGGSGEKEEITILVAIPRQEDSPKQWLYVTLTPENFALALTGRGGIVGQLCSRVYDPTPKAKPPARRGRKQP